MQLFTIYKVASQEEPLDVYKIIILSFYVSLYFAQLNSVFIPCNTLNKEVRWVCEYIKKK